MKRNLIVGCGLSGAVVARCLADRGESSLIIDRRSHIAGNIFDYKDSETGIIVHQYGPHVFHTNVKKVWDFLSRFTNWNYYIHKAEALIDNNLVNIPFNLNTLYKVFPNSFAHTLENKLINLFGYNVKVSIMKLKENEDNDLKFLSEFIYEKVFKNYTIKQWGLSPELIDPMVMSRVPVYISRDNGYFQDIYQGIPLLGYTKMVENMLDNELIKVKLNTDYTSIDDLSSYSKIFFTGSIDEFFDYKYGVLPYRSLRFEIEHRDVEFFNNCAQTNYPNNYDFTRITEHKYFLNNKSDTTVISMEYSSAFELGKNERYYPIANEQSAAIYNKYFDEAKKISNLCFIGRLGDYKYYNMDQTVERAMSLFDGNRK